MQDVVTLAYNSEIKTPLNPGCWLIHTYRLVPLLSPMRPRACVRTRASDPLRVHPREKLPVKISHPGRRTNAYSNVNSCSNSQFARTSMAEG